MENATVIEPAVAAPPQISLLGVLRIPAVRQVLLLIGVAAAIAAGFAVVLWSQTPGYTQLYGSLSATESAQVADALQAADIEYKVSDNGMILVAGAQLHDARMQLASQGLPQSVSAGMYSMQEQSSFGVSQFMETARYQHALESELARTITSLGAVSDARVHLALPKQTAFLRDSKSASASILLQLFRGRVLEADQASAIVHLVASSVPNLAASDVTLIDQNGRLLSSGTAPAADAMAATQFKYSRQLEENYKRRIEDLLTPLVGAGRVRAEVVADIDFTYIEETSESFDPARTVVRSEQVREDQTIANALSSGGIPGALSNQPPEASGVPVEATQTEAVATEPKNSSRSSTRNFEVDRTIRHTRPQSGAIRRLSVAVLIDDAPLDAENPEPSVSDQDIERYTSLVREAVGFSEARGDTVVVLSEAFLAVDEPAAVEPPPIWEKPFFRDAIKQVLGAIVALALGFGILRPMLRGVVTAAPAVSGEYIPAGAEHAAGGYSAAQIAGGPGGAPLPSYDEKVAAVKNMSGNDPARVAQVVRKWVTTDE